LPRRADGPIHGAQQFAGARMPKMLLRFAALAATALFLAGCQTAAEVRANDEAKCRSYGFRPGTDAFAKCLQRIELDRRADFRAARLQSPMWDRPTYIYVPVRRR
jgi:hypothetical protein